MRALPAVPLLAGCVMLGRTQPEGPPPDPGGVALDPVGVYDVTMSSPSRVSHGTIEIRGEPRKYRGTLVLGTVAVVLESIETGAGILHLGANMPAGTLVLRLAGDGRCLSGNWVLGVQRGAVRAEKRGGGDERDASGTGAGDC